MATYGTLAGIATIVGNSGVVPWYLSGGISAANCVAAYQPKGAVSLAASYINIANPGTYNAAPGTAPNFNGATGWGFTGTQYLTTGITPASGWSMAVRYSDVADGATTQYLAGCRNTTGNRRFYLFVSSDVGNGIGYGSGGALVVNPELLAGVAAVVGQQGYRNGVSDGAAITAWDSPNSAYTIYLGASNQNDTPQAAGTKKIQAIAIYNTTITTQIAALAAAMAAL